MQPDCRCYYDIGSKQIDTYLHKKYHFKHKITKQQTLAPPQKANSYQLYSAFSTLNVSLLALKKAHVARLRTRLQSEL